MSKVLIVDDDPIVLAILARSLQSIGADVITCREIEAAEAALDLYPVSRVVTDLRVSALGGMEGTRLLRHVALHRPDVKRFVVSAYLDDRIHAILNALGVEYAFSKPCDPNRIASHVMGRGHDWRKGPGDVQGIEPLSFFMASGRLHALLQPIVSLRPGSAPFAIRGLAASSSAPDDCLLKNPALLSDLALRKDRLSSVDLACARAAVQEAGRLGGCSSLFIRMHPGSLATPGFAESFAKEVADGGMRPSDVVIALSDRRGMPHALSLVDRLAPLRKRGFRLSLDNYGEGDSNVNLLLDLNPDYVKLAGVLTEGIGVDPRRHEVLRSTCELMSRLGIRPILSGVEKATEVRTALEMGFEYGLGRLFGAPGRAKDLKGRGYQYAPGPGLDARANDFEAPSLPFALPA